MKPVRDRRYLVSGTAIGGLTFALAAYVVRIISKIHFQAGAGTIFTDLWWDDGVITLCVLVVIGQSIGSVFRMCIQVCSAYKRPCLPVTVARYGLGKDIWTLVTVEKGVSGVS